MGIGLRTKSLLDSRFILKRISMKSAKQIANDMADAVNIDSNLVRGFAQGFISVPVDFYYLGYDYIDTENRWLNSQDKERFIRLNQVRPGQ